jgi:hypothetical protein
MTEIEVKCAAGSKSFTVELDLTEGEKSLNMGLPKFSFLK